MLTTELVPAAQPNSRRLIIVLHGLGDSLDGYRWMPRFMELPWLNYLLVNGPDDYFGGYAWFDLHGDPEPGVSRSRALLFELLDQLPRQGYPPEDTVMFGFSQGSLMAVEVGARYPKRLAGVVGISGYVHDPVRLLRELSPVARQQRFLITHGTEDPLLPFEPVKRQVEQLQTAGLDIEWHAFDKAHTIAGEDELRVIRDFVVKCYEPAPTVRPPGVAAA